MHLILGLRRGLYKGTLLTYSRDLPSFATYFFAYERLRHWTGAAALEEAESPDYNSWAWRTAVAGGVAGVCGWAVAIPMDTAKNRHQASMAVRKCKSLKGLHIELYLFLTCSANPPWPP